MRLVRSGWCAWCLLNVERYGVEEGGDAEEDVDDVDDDDEKKMQTLFSLLFAFRVGWLEDVCVWDVGSRERVVIGGRTCGRGRCTRV